MFNHKAKNIIILFSPGRKGNFLKNCLTFADDCADSSYKQNTKKLEHYTTIQPRPSWWSEKHTKEEPGGWGKGHVDFLENWSVQRFKEAEDSEKYVHCAHIKDLSHANPLPFKNYYTIKIKNDIHIQDYNDAEYNDDSFPQFVLGDKKIIFHFIILLAKAKLIDEIKKIDKEIDWNINFEHMKKYINYYYEKITERKDNGK